MFKSPNLLAFLLAGLLAIGSIGCDSDSGVIDDDDDNGQPVTYEVALSGDEEVPPVETDATGSTTLNVNADTTEVEYELSVGTIDSLTAAHIHLGEAGVNGNVVAFLYGGDEADTLSVVGADSTIATGTITAADLVGPLEGMDLQTLADSMAAGQAYVNVHTVANPAGEIRGQIVAQE